MSDPAAPTRSRRQRRPSAGIVGLVGVVIAMVPVTGCGPPEDRTALALDHPQWVAGPADADEPSLRFDTECADVTEIALETAAGIGGVPLVTVWGHPRTGRCRTEVVVTVPAGTTRVEDAATGMVVDLPAP